MRDLIDDIARATAFLGRLPVPGRFFDGHDGRMGGLAGVFALSGLVLSLPAGLLLALLAACDAPPMLAAFLALAVQTLVTGALHEDGLADCADGFGGGRSRERILEIMKDSRIGAYGVIGLILVFGLRAAALAALAETQTPLTLLLLFLGAAMVSRAAMGWHWQRLPSARSGGVADSAGQPTVRAVHACLASALGVLAVFVVIDLPFAPVLAGLLVTAGIAAYFTGMARRKIGGHTGDTIGATQQLTETGFLAALALLA